MTSTTYTETRAGWPVVRVRLEEVGEPATLVAMRAVQLAVRREVDAERAAEEALGFAVEPTHAVVKAVAAAREAVDAAARRELWSLSPSEAAELPLRLHELATAVAGLQLRALAHADSVDAAAADGATSTAAWFAGKTVLTRPVAAREVRLAVEVERRELVRDGLAAATVNPEQAAVVVRALAKLPADLAPETCLEAERVLVECCAHHDARDLRILGRRILEVVDPAAAEAHEARLLANEERRASDTTRFTLADDGHGTTRGRFAIPSAVAQVLRVHLMALASPARHVEPTPDATNEERQQRESEAAEQTALEQARVTPDKLGRAFCEYVTRYPADATPQAGGVAATVLVTMTLADLLDTPGASHEPCADEDSGARVADVLGGLRRPRPDVAVLDGMPITATRARQWACEAGVIPIVLGGPGEVLDVGRQRRLHNRAQRIAMAVRDGGCTAEGCDWPPAMCQAHHDDPWSRDGGTSVERGRLLCPRHHARIHDPTYDVEHLFPHLPGGAVRFHRRT